MVISNLYWHHALTWLLLSLLAVGNNAESEQNEYQTYIIHMDRSQKPSSFLSHESWHRFTLKSLSYAADDTEMLLYSYNHVMHGFSARLTLSQLAELEKSPAHLATYQESFGKLFTTHSTKFLGLDPNLGIWPRSTYGEDVIIGIIDTGIWPESESFSDEGMPPVPQRWKGRCENGTEFSSSSCNRKLIGAQFFGKGLHAAGKKVTKEFASARDWIGHGTHTASTAAGNYVLGVSHFGYARGTARGVAPRAHVAMYKVLFAMDTGDSFASDVLAGMDQAIADGVDIMSLSLGFRQTPYFNNVIAIASLSAIEKGIFVVCAAGNDGAQNTTYNGAPWITTVGAGTLDRSFTATMTLENGLTIEGTSYFPESIHINDATLYYGKVIENKAICYHNAFNQSEVQGKIVICDNSSRTDVRKQIEELKGAGAYGGIFMADVSTLGPQDHTIPALVLPTATGALVRDYVAKVSPAKLKRMKFMLTRSGTKPAPQVGYFSSRGPDPINPGVLKPDILAPGVDVLAAIVPNRVFMKTGKYNLVTDYALYSGTSMAAPHVAGVAALLKAVHRDWSPAAIRSAMMTTAYVIDNTNTSLKDQLTAFPATPLSFGAGHINPNKAMEPGLVYEIGVQDYIEFLCGLGYTDKQMSATIRRSQWNCSYEQTDLNYPSFIAILNAETSYPARKSFSRFVTNVGGGSAVYKATLETPTGMRIAVRPTTLAFTQNGQKQGFVVTVEIDEDALPVVYGFLKWTDEHNHVVSSPILAVKV